MFSTKAKTECRIAFHFCVNTLAPFEFDIPNKDQKQIKFPQVKPLYCNTKNKKLIPACFIFFPFTSFHATCVISIQFKDKIALQREVHSKCLEVQANTNVYNQSN
jgi:hypothetical protein